MYGPVHILLIFTLWACPLNCLGGLQGPASPDSERHGCACCAAVAEPQEASQPAEKAPQPDRDQACDCGNCLCHGAVRCDDAGLLDQMFGAVALPAAGVNQVFQLSLGRSSGPLVHPPLLARSAAATGRQVRILHQSFVI